MTEREKLHWRDDKLVAKRDRGRGRQAQRQRVSSDVFLPLYVVRVVCVQFSGLWQRWSFMILLFNLSLYRPHLFGVGTTAPPYPLKWTFAEHCKCNECASIVSAILRQREKHALIWRHLCCGTCKWALEICVNPQCPFKCIIMSVFT